MGLEAACCGGDRVIVVMDANRNKVNVDALDWALKYVVRRKDTVLVLGVLFEFGKNKNSCFPLNMGISISGIWERLEFSSTQGHAEARPRVLGEEIERKREQYQNELQPFYRQCKKNEVKLEVKLAVGFCPADITMEQALSSNPRWIVLDSSLKKYKATIYANVECNVALVKAKDFATWMPSRAFPPATAGNSPGNCSRIDKYSAFPAANPPENINPDGPDSHRKPISESSAQVLPPQSPGWFPLSWRSGFPRAFSQSELDVITNSFSKDNVVREEDNLKFFEGVLQETPVIVSSFSENDERFWTMLKILSRVRHRNIMNLVGYCCTGTAMFLLSDYPCMGTLEHNLRYDDFAKNLTWKARWYIAIEVGGSLRYLHEECVDGAIAHLLVRSFNVAISHGCTPMLGNFIRARFLKDDFCNNEAAQDRQPDVEEEKWLSADVRDFGMLLIELITGKSIRLFQEQGEGQTLIDWALPLIEDGCLNKALDPRLEDTSDSRLVHLMAKAALLCLKNLSGMKLSMSEVLAVVRDD